MKRLTTEQFIEKAIKVHGDKYDYSKVEYVNNHTKICIICNIHGEFWQMPYKHLEGFGCAKCSYKIMGKKNILTTEQFIEKAIKVHGDKYDYSKVEYVNSETKVCIICKKHGEFWQTPHIHLRGGGCKQCADEKKCNKVYKGVLNSTTEQFIEKAIKVHGDKYDYSKVEYVNNKTKICIICPKHGEFWQKPSSHLSGNGCNLCAIDRLIIKKTLTTEQFIEKARKVHGDKYDYSKVEYKGALEKVCVICPKHGEFWQTPNAHIHLKEGCSSCNESHLEREIKLFLQEKNIKFEQQKRFEWLGKQSLDFYLPEYNIAIECQGIQHFSAHSYSRYKTRNLKNQILLDECKYDKCLSKLKLLYYVDNKDYVFKENVSHIYNKTNVFQKINDIWEEL